MDERHIDKDAIRKVAQEFFDSDEGHESDQSCRWLPERSEGEAVAYLAAFALFLLTHEQASA